MKLLLFVTFAALAAAQNAQVVPLTAAETAQLKQLQATVDNALKASRAALKLLEDAEGKLKAAQNLALKAHGLKDERVSNTSTGGAVNYYSGTTTATTLTTAGWCSQEWMTDKDYKFLVKQ